MIFVATSDAQYFSLYISTVHPDFSVKEIVGKYLLKNISYTGLKLSNNRVYRK